MRSSVDAGTLVKHLSAYSLALVLRSLRLILPVSLVEKGKVGDSSWRLLGSFEKVGLVGLYGEPGWRSGPVTSLTIVDFVSVDPLESVDPFVYSSGVLLSDLKD